MAKDPPYEPRSGIRPDIGATVEGQRVRMPPGLPVIFGSFSATISMQSGAPTFGGAEPAMALFASAAPPLTTMVCR